MEELLKEILAELRIGNEWNQAAVENAKRHMDHSEAHMDAMRQRAERLDAERTERMAEIREIEKRDRQYQYQWRDIVITELGEKPIAKENDPA